jgi:hypothetical protein
VDAHGGTVLAAPNAGGGLTVTVAFAVDRPDAGLNQPRPSVQCGRSTAAEDSTVDLPLAALDPRIAAVDHVDPTVSADHDRTGATGE